LLILYKILYMQGFQQNTLDLSKVIADKKHYDFTENESNDYQTFINQISLFHHNDNTIDANKKIEPKNDNFDISNILDELKTVLDTPKTSDVSINEFGYTYPLNIDNTSLVWNQDMKLPAPIETTCRVLSSIFSSIKDTDYNSKNVTLYPPSSKKNVTTVIDRAPHGCIFRILACFCSDEEFTLTFNQGNPVKYVLAKNNAISIKFGVCSAVSFSYNNNNSFIFKNKPTDRGKQCYKNSSKRWILVIDFIGNSQVITNQIKKHTNQAANGDEKVQKRLETQLENIVKSTDIVSKSASAKALLQTEKNKFTNNLFPNGLIPHNRLA